MKEVTVKIGDIQADLHEQFVEEAGEEYRERIRQAVEDEVMDLYRQQERMLEQDEMVGELDDA